MMSHTTCGSHYDEPISHAIHCLEKRFSVPDLNYNQKLLFGKVENEVLEKFHVFF